MQSRPRPASPCRRPAVAFAFALALAALPAVPAQAAPGPGRAGDEKALTVLAEQALQRGNCLDAADDYVRAAAVSSDLSLAKRATEVSVGCEQWPRALRVANRWRELAPQDPVVARTVGVIALKLHHLAEARAAFAVTLGLSKDPEHALAALIPIAAQTADNVAAWSALKDFGADTSLRVPTLAAFATLALDADDFAAARGFAERALAIDPADTRTAMLRVKILVGQNDEAAALAAAREIAASGAEGTTFVLADALADLDHFDEARAELGRLASVDASRADAERRLALLAYRTGDFQDARRRFAEMYGRREGGTEALYYLSLLAELSGDTDAALSGYEQLAGGEAASLARARAASILIRGGNRDRALAVLDDTQGTGGGRTIIDATLEKAQILSANGAAADALKLTEQLLAKFPGHPQVEYERATALERAGRVRDSVTAFEAMLKDRPQDSMIENALGYTLADHRMQLSRAEDLIRQALKASPDSPAILDSLGWVRYRRGDARDGLTSLERAYRLGRDAEIAAHWGELLWSVGRQSEARAVWTHALALAPDSVPLKAVVARLAPVKAAPPGP